MFKKILLTSLIVLIATPLAAGAVYLWEYGTFDERAKIAEKIGLVTDADFYKGTYEQNIALLSHIEDDLYFEDDLQLGVSVPSVIAVFETSLRYSIDASSTAMTLVSGITKDGTTLSGTYGLVLNEGTTKEEFVLATCTNIACTFVTRGISSLDGETSVYALIKEHRRGNSVKITNYPVLGILARVANGDEGFPNKLWYDDQPTFASTTDIVTKKYVDDVGAGGFTASNIDGAYGLQVFGTAPETVGIDLASLSGLRMDNDGDLQISSSTGSGIYVDTDNTLKVNTSTDFTFTGTVKFGTDGTASSTSLNTITSGSSTPADYFHSHEIMTAYDVNSTTATSSGTTEAILREHTIKGGDMGKNGFVRLHMHGVSEMGGDTYIKALFGGQAIATTTMFATGDEVNNYWSGTVEIHNRGDDGLQWAFIRIWSVDASALWPFNYATSTEISVDTSVDQIISIQGDNAAAGNETSIRASDVQVFRKE